MATRIKIITIIYFLILVGIVVLADSRGTQFFLKLNFGIPYFDKVGHFLLMGGFSFFVNLVLRAREFSVWKFRYLLGSLLVFIIVTIEEFSQMFISGRAFDWGDLVADYLGIFIFGELARVIYCKYLVKS